MTVNFTLMSEAVDAFDEFLNECDEPVIVHGLEFDRSEILRQCDPIAYRVYFFNFVDSLGVDSDTLLEDVFIPG